VSAEPGLEAAGKALGDRGRPGSASVAEQSVEAPSRLAGKTTKY
jgi:hypothetical protein